MINIKLFHPKDLLKKIILVHPNISTYNTQTLNNMTDCVDNIL